MVDDWVPIRVTWAGGGPPVLDPEWAEVAEEIGRRFDDWHRGIGDPTAIVPPALAGPKHESRRTATYALEGLHSPGHWRTPGQGADVGAPLCAGVVAEAQAWGCL